MSNLNALMSSMLNKVGKVTYSMTYRNGPGSYDCSSAVYFALRDAGWKIPWVGNTESMFVHLPQMGWSKVSPNAQGSYDARPGDIFIWGVQGQSAGAFGHTGVFVNTDDIVHCNYGYNGMTVNNHDQIWHANGRPQFHLYRYTGGTAAAPSVNSKPATSVSPDAPHWNVDPGDTLAKIAMYYYGEASPATLRRLGEYNSIANINVLSVGQKVYIPGPLVWTVEPDDTWEKIDDYYGYARGYTQKRNGGSLTVGRALNIWN